MIELIYLLAVLLGGLLFISPRKIYLALITLPRDLKFLWVILKLGITLTFWTKFNFTIPKLFRKTANKYPDKVAFYFESEKWTFKKVDKFSNKIAHYFKSMGYKRGDSVALLMDNRPEYVCIWLGLAKIGIVTALVNTNIMSKETLTHAIKSSKSKALIYGSRFKSVSQGASELPDFQLFQFNDDSKTSEILHGAFDLVFDLIRTPDSDLNQDIDAGKSDDLLVYIYTSGTTGLPKASVIKNQRYIMAFLYFNLSISIKKEDVLYIPLPLYHSLGGMIGISQCLIEGTAVVLKNKFSASNFWKDCEKYKCTIAQYIGEMARYVILAHQNSKDEVNYTLPKLFGNGMKPTTWKQFVNIFNVEQVYEFYGATEANFLLINMDNKIGSCGYIPIWADPFAPVALIKCDSSGEPIRNENGFCDTCSFNEPGLLICRVSNLIAAIKFDGYSDKASTSKKLLKGVYKEGDTYFNTGDIMGRDETGCFYFKDRTGDTFRWKGENVATTEVEEILTRITNRTVAVYGVEIPGNEGKAGMASIADPEKSLDLQQFLKDCRSQLPAYAIPVFLRIVDNIPQTGTFKMQKTGLQKEGYDIAVVKDTIYVLDTTTKEYVLLNSNIFNKIQNHELRV